MPISLTYRLDARMRAGLCQSYVAEKFRSVEVRFFRIDGCPAQEMRIRSQVCAFIEVAFHFYGLACIFYTHKIQRYDDKKVPAEHSFELLERPGSARWITFYSVKLLIGKGVPSWRLMRHAAWAVPMQLNSKL